MNTEQRNPIFAELYEILDSYPTGEGGDNVYNALTDLLLALKYEMEQEKRKKQILEYEQKMAKEIRKEQYETRVKELRKNFKFYKCGELPFAINQYILDFIATPYVPENEEAGIKWCRERNHLCRDDYLTTGLSSHPPTAWEQIMNHTFRKTFVDKYYEYVRDGLRKMHIVDLRVIQKGIYAFTGKSKMDVANHVFQNLLCGGNFDWSQEKQMKKKQILKVILAIKRMDKRGRVIGGINYNVDERMNHRHNCGQFKPTPYKYVEHTADSDDDDIDM